MFYVYILKSKIKKYFYVGMTKDVHSRLKRHNDGQVQSSKAYKPFEIIFTKCFDNRVKARDFEKFLKIRSNKEKILKKLGHL